MSTIKVDTIQKANGTSQIGIDKIGGVTSASIVNVIAEGGTNTTNLAQGLAKAWAKCAADGTSITDSFNITSLSDDGTALQTLTIANDMTNANYSSLATSIDSTCILIADSHAAGTYRLVSRNNAGTLTDSITHSALLGDLA